MFEPRRTLNYQPLFTHPILRVTLNRASFGTDLVTSQDLEGLHDLLCSICVRRLSCHEVQEGVKGDIACAVGVHDGHDTLEISLTLATHNKKAVTLATTDHKKALTSATIHNKAVTLATPHHNKALTSATTHHNSKTGWKAHTDAVWLQHCLKLSHASGTQSCRLRDQCTS